VYEIGADMFIVGPCLVVEYRYNEYATVINLIRLSGIIINIDWLIIAVIKKISLIRLILGGAAIFAQQNINHQKAIVGMMVNIPLVNTILRVIVILYLIFAIQNNADDLNPWAIIMASLACIPNFEFDSMPATIRPICPTEE
jgi:uncharacterized membrane protein